MAVKPLRLPYPLATERIKRWRPFLALVLLAGLGLSFSPVTIAAPAQKPALSDTEIANAVADQLFLDAAVIGYTIKTTVENGIVTLTGRANNLLARERAVRIAETVRGVKAVIDRIEVRHSDITDEAIADQINSALIYNPRTESYEVDVAVDQGRVTLTGTVQSWQEKQFAERIAKSVKSVKSVDNQITINYAAPRADGEILQDVEGALGWDRYIDDGLIDVTVQDGVVTLEGTVGSAAELQRARTKAWVNGVQAVDASALEVAYWARDDKLRKDKYTPKTDSEVKTAIKDALSIDPRVLAENVNVDVLEGIVTLRGTVDNLASSRAAAQVARDTVGVWRVRNRLRVGLVEPVSDADIYSRVRNALINDPFVELYEIEVTVNEGRVTLDGLVDTTFEKAQAEDVVARLSGVVTVNNNLNAVNARPLPYQPYVDERNNYDYGRYDFLTSTTVDDWAIRQDIEEELWWSPFVDSDKINVAVEEGVATLTGTVDTWSDRYTATENALEGGAVRVINKLDVVHGPEFDLF